MQRELLDPIDHRVWASEFERVRYAGSIADLDASIQDFVRSQGFERYDAFISDRKEAGLDGSGVLARLGNVPAAFQVLHECAAEGRSDPFMQLCGASTLPVCYDQLTYVRCGLGATWEHQAAFGYAEGIGFSYHLSPSRRFMFGVDRRTPLPRKAEELTDLVARVQLFATCTQVAALHLWHESPQTPRPSPCRLSPREHECLQWAAEGKTAWETGRILSLAEASVAKILASALQKLDCANKPQAVVKATRMGLIH